MKEPEVCQAAGKFKDSIAALCALEANGFFDNAKGLDIGKCVFDLDTHPCKEPVPLPMMFGSVFSTGFLTGQ